MKKSLALCLAAATLFCATLSSAPAFADRTTQVNDRLEEQSGRTQSGRRHHKMSQGEQMRSDEAQYRMNAEEQNMRNKHHGKLTRRDQRKLNRQLNRNSRRIRNDKNN